MTTLTAPPKELTLNYVRVNQKYKLVDLNSDKISKLEELIQNLNNDYEVRDEQFLVRQINELKYSIRIGKRDTLFEFKMVRIAPILDENFYKYNHDLAKYQDRLINFKNILDFSLIKSGKDYFIYLTTKTGPFTFPSFYSNYIVQLTEGFEWVRSKSERTIADALKMEKINYEYETVLISISGRKFRPDFTIESHGKSMYWEYVGMINDPSYKSRWDEKKEIYKSLGITENGGLFGTLITAEERSENNFSPLHARRIIDMKIKDFGLEKWIYNEKVYIKKIDGLMYYYSEYFNDYIKIFIKSRKDNSCCLQFNNQKVYLLVRDQYPLDDLIAFTLVVVELVYKFSSKNKLLLEDLKLRGVYIDNKYGGLGILVHNMYSNFSSSEKEKTKHFQKELINSLIDSEYYLTDPMSMDLQVNYREAKFGDDLLMDIYYRDDDAWWMDLALDN
ncbi:hypothetical protein [Priestia megaterium]|uniref:hypothetical protein n=1 Tax=Priestia megaterium TaxID=1404 RepID=UPI00203F5180|nr:hypothetical protein [Priestia megaterium]MCM3186373.1 hypothetical protein [Priestia megaterium]